MTNPISRLIAQAEVNVTEMGRRAVDQAAATVKARSQEVVSDVMRTATSTVKTVAIKAGLALFAGVMLIVAVIFGLIALYDYLASLMGPIEALLAMAALFLVLGIAGIVVMMTMSSSATVKDKKAPAIAATQDVEAAQRAMAASQQPPVEAASAEVRDDPTAQLKSHDPDQAMRSGLDAVVSALGDAGFRREQAGLRAGIAIASQMRPVQLVSLALLGGFLAGVRSKRGRRLS
ncbi:hypothetical protein [Lichenihabitans psoromatis]|uniref:hypothetical protein n=1 Tax=Lichenihabitans psoromatis TaxID=2528642 RepID=UPI001036AAE3|nr:hypothetical protein [Lichenihabitans psoromatis]